MLRYLTAFCGLVFGVLLNVHAETIVVDRIYLIVNSQMLTRSEAHDVKSAIMSQKASGGKTQAELDNQLLMNLLQEMLLLDRANALKIVPMENEIDSRLNSLAEEQPQLLDVYSEEDLKEQLVRDFKKHRVISREVDSKIHINSLDIEKFCYRNMLNQRKIGLAQILLQGSEEEISKRVDTILQDFKNGVPFEELAKSYSADSNAKQTGGKLGVFKPGDLLEAIGEVAKTLEPGQISEIVETNMGKHLLYIYRQDFPPGLDCQNLSEEQRAEYSNVLHKQKREGLLDTYMSELYACANIEI
ncbi:MAG: peptidylprolyl isomerase, partial [SAR324 cluster bacterium]|nr:peptidylprolyl isomerase [SAR324 cluster bacterium]